jgi:hypothetical protein
LEPAGSAIFASSRDVQLSHEDDELGSLFTNFLCDCITSGNGGVQTTGGLITVPDAIDYIKARFAEKGGAAQNPLYTVRNSEGPLWIALNVSGSIDRFPARREIEAGGDSLSERCFAAKLDELDSDLLAQYAVDHLVGELRTIQAIAETLGLFPPGRRDVPSKAAILCFGRRPSEYFPNAVSMFSAGDRASDSFERSAIDGPLLRQLQNLVHLTSQQLRTESRFDEAGGRSDVVEIPVVVIREVIANALAHRDFDSNGRVHVHVDADYVTISNPGVEPDGRSWADMLDHPGDSLTPNRRLANLLQAVRGYEGVGRGFSMLHTYRFDRGEGAVTFEQRGRTVVCKLRRPPATGLSLVSRANYEARLSQFVLERANALAHHRDPFARDGRAAKPDHQVPTSAGRAQMLDNLAASLREPGALIALTGDAGAGKSYMLRQLYVMLASVERNKVAHGVSPAPWRAVPIFVSLRDLNPDLPFLAGISVTTAIDPALLEYVLGRHDLVLILDGLDECAPGARAQVVEGIREVREAHPRLSILVSSRPVGAILIDHSERTVEIGALSREEVRRIVDAEMPRDAADAFWQAVIANNEALIANPLMLRLTMQAYLQYADLPDSGDTLMAMAFETLWQRHDAMKGGFVRQRRTSIDRNLARRVLGRLALFLTARRLMAAPRTEVADFLKQSFAHDFRSDLFVRQEDLILDFVETDLLTLDDDKVAFTHRAFLEYFALDALSDLKVSGKDLGRLVLGLVSAGIHAERIISAIARWPLLASEHEALKEALHDESSIPPMWIASLEAVRAGVAQKASERTQHPMDFSNLFGG